MGTEIWQTYVLFVISIQPSGTQPLCHLMKYPSPSPVDYIIQQTTT